MYISQVVHSQNNNIRLFGVKTHLILVILIVFPGKNALKYAIS